MGARSFEFGADYPSDRAGKMFAFHAIKLLGVPMVARTLGGNGCNLIRVIATLEDDQFYCGAVIATDDDLRPRMDVTEKTLVTARRRCIDAGWLHYEPGEKGTPSRMWVTIPQHVDLRLRANIQWKNSTTTGTETSTETGTESGTTTSTTTDPSLFPNPIPNSPPPAASPGVDWRLVEIEMSNIGIGETSVPLARMQSNGVPAKLALDVIRFAERMQLWTAVRIRTRLIQLRPGQLPEDRSRWMKPDRFPEPTPEEKAQAEERRKQELKTHERNKAEEKEALKREEEARDRKIQEANEKRQLLIDWEEIYGPRLDVMPDDEVFDIASRAFPNHAAAFEKFGVRNRLVRPIVLQALAGFFNKLRGVR